MPTSGDTKLTRRAAIGGLALLGLGGGAAFAQGFAGLAESARGFAQVTPGRRFSFPADHGAHPNYRIEWWYVTANLVDAHGAAYGSQWTLFRQALSSQGLAPGGDDEGWANQQIWMAHAAVTRADTHRTSETFARGGVGQAGVETNPLHAWIDSWALRGADGMDAMTVSPLDLTAAGTDFSYALHLEANRPLVLQGDGGYSRKSEREQASYYYSQPFFTVIGNIAIDGLPIDVTGQAWMDREWSSQPLAADQTGWDWFGLHFKTGEKLMLYRMREKSGNNYVSGNWILSGGSRQLAAAEIAMQPKQVIDIDGHKLPVEWHIAIPSLAVEIDCVPLNPKAWMGTTSFPYWEGPISFHGTHTGVGYLELTGY